MPGSEPEPKRKELPPKQNLLDWLSEVTRHAEEIGDPTSLAVSLYGNTVMGKALEIFQVDPGSQLSVPLFDILAHEPLFTEDVPYLDEQGGKVARAAGTVAAWWHTEYPDSIAEVLTEVGLQAPLFLHVALIQEIHAKSQEGPLPQFATPLREFINSLKTMITETSISVIGATYVALAEIKMAQKRGEITEQEAGEIKEDWFTFQNADVINH